MRKSYIEDVYSLGLIYVYMYSHKTRKMVSLYDLEAFYKEIEKNLKIMGSEYHGIFSTNEDSIYFISSNENGEIYYILKPTFDLKKAIKNYIDSPSINYLVASQMDNALNTLGLVKINGDIMPKSNYISKENLEIENNNFNEEMERELKDLNLGCQVILIAEEDKGTKEDYATLETKILLKTKENEAMMEKSLIYSMNSLPVL